MADGDMRLAAVVLLTTNEGKRWAQEALKLQPREGVDAFACRSTSCRPAADSRTEVQGNAPLPSDIATIACPRPRFPREPAMESGPLGLTLARRRPPDLCQRKRWAAERRVLGR